MSKITETDYQEYSKLIEEGHSQRSACLILGLNRSTIQRYIKSVLEDEVSEGGEYYLETPKKASFAEACSNIANAVCNIGKAMGGESNERYLELPNTENVENKPKLLFYDIETSLASHITFNSGKSI